MHFELLKALVTYIYARTSGDINGEESIPNQLNLCKRYAASHGYIISGELADEKKTGTNVERESFQKLLYLVKQNKVDVILVPYFDRISRVAEELSNFLILLKSKGIECISVSNGRKLSQMSQMEIVMVSIMAEEDNKSRTKRIFTSKEISKKKGEFLHNPPLGYERDERRHLVINEVEATVVRLIFDLYLRDHSPSAIAKLLGSGEYSNLRKWQASTVEGILTNKKYTGHNYKKIENEEGGFSYELVSTVPHQAIITESMFDSVIKKMEKGKKKRTNKKREKHFHLLKGFLYCPHCFAKMRADSLYYICPHSNCDVGRVRKDRIEPVVLEYLSNPKRVQEDEKYQKKIKELEIQKKLLEKEKDKVLLQFAKNLISPVRFKERMFDISEQIKSANSQIDFEFYTHDPTSYGELIQKKYFETLYEKMKSENLKLTYQKWNDGKIEVVEL